MSKGSLNCGFDEQALSELQEDMGDAMAEFVAGFLSSMDATRSRMRDCLKAAQLDTLGESAHGLKGTAGYLGAVELSSNLAEIQRQCASSACAPTVEPLLDRMDELAVQVRRRLEPLL